MQVIYRCHVCDVEKKRANDLLRHLINVHGKNLEWFARHVNDDRVLKMYQICNRLKGLVVSEDEGQSEGEILHVQGDDDYIALS